MLNKEILIKNSLNRLQQQANLITNGLGYEVDLTSLTAIRSKIIEEVNYEVKPSDFMPVIPGQNAFAEELLTYKSYNLGDDFESGIIKGNSNVGRMASSDVAIESVRIPIVDWGKMLQYNLFDLGKSSKSGNWNLVEAKERSRAKNYKLGLQKIAFLGSEVITGVKGLLTQDDVNSNTTTIPTFISSMTTTQLETLVKEILAKYRANNDYTAYPTHFAIPEDDFLGLGVQISKDFPAMTRFEYLEKMFKQMTMNPNFRVLPLAYASKARNAEVLGSGSGLNRYVLYKYDTDSLEMQIPIEYTTTIQDTINGFEYQSVAYSQFTGCKAYRPKEMLYFDHSV